MLDLLVIFVTIMIAGAWYICKTIFMIGLFIAPLFVIAMIMNVLVEDFIKGRKKDINKV